MTEQLSFPATPQRRDTLERARQRVKTHLEDGIECPCCGQLCKLYPRKLNAAMAHGLIWLVNATSPSGRWAYIHEAPMIQGRHGGGDFAKLEHFGLIVSKPNVDDDSKRCSGYWRPTEDGVAFAHNRATVPAFVLLFNNTVHGYAKQQITIFDALATKFDYAELMSTYGGDA